MLLRNRLPSAVAAAAILTYFFALAGAGLRADICPDDLMNIYHAWVEGIPKLALQTVAFVIPSYRPLGGLFYTVLFDAFGLNPLPFRIVCTALMVFNLWLVYRLVTRLTSDPVAGYFAAGVFAFHREFAALYYTTGTCYDVLCFTFFYLAWLAWLRERWWAVVVCQILALDSKEMAVTLPIFLALTATRRHAKWLTVTGAISALYVARTLLESKLRTAGNPEYALEISFRHYYNSLVNLFAQLANHGELTTVPKYLYIGLALMLAWLAIRRERHLVIGLALLLIGILPIAFIAPRGLYASYIPLVGVAIYIGDLFATLLRRVPHREMAAAALLIVVLYAGGRWWIRNRAYDMNWINQESHAVGAAIRQVQALHLHLAPDAKVLFLRDPFDAYDWAIWDSLYVVRLQQRKPEISVLTTRRLNRPPSPNELATSTVVLDTTPNGIVVVPVGQASRPVH